MKTTLKLNGLHCGNCVKSVENALKTLPTVRDVQINLASQMAQIDSDETAQTLIETIENIGFDAELAG